MILLEVAKDEVFLLFGTIQLPLYHPCYLHQSSALQNVKQNQIFFITTMAFDRPFYFHRTSKGIRTARCKKKPLTKTMISSAFKAVEVEYCRSVESKKNMVLAKALPYSHPFPQSCLFGINYDYQCVFGENISKANANKTCRCRLKRKQVELTV